MNVIGYTKDEINIFIEIGEEFTKDYPIEDFEDFCRQYAEDHKDEYHNYFHIHEEHRQGGNPTVFEWEDFYREIVNCELVQTFFDNQ